jgi:hypothetical protein
MKLKELFEDFVPASKWSYNDVKRELNSYEKNNMEELNNSPVIGTINDFVIKKMTFGRELTHILLNKENKPIGFFVVSLTPINDVKINDTFYDFSTVAVETIGIHPSYKGQQLSIKLYEFALKEYGVIVSDESQTIRGNNIWKNLSNIYPDNVFVLTKHNSYYTLVPFQSQNLFGGQGRFIIFKNPPKIS